MLKPNMIPLLSAAMFAAFVLPGCFRYQPMSGSPPVAEPLPDGAWVELEISPGLEALLGTPETIRTVEIDREELKRMLPQLTDTQLDEAQRKLDDRVYTNEIRHGGLVRFWGENKPADTKMDGVALAFSFGGRLRDFEADGSYLSADELAWVEAVDRIKEEQGTKRSINSWAGVGLRYTNEDDRWRLDEGFKLGLPDPLMDQQAVGVVLHITSLFENKYEHEMLDRFRAFGWSVAHLESDIFVRGDNALAARERDEMQSAERRRRLDANPEYVDSKPDEQTGEWTRSDSMRMFEEFREVHAQVEAAYPDIDRGFEIHPDTDIDAHAAMIAQRFDRRLTEHAYAARALIEEVDRREPTLAGKPVVVMGFSAGALVTPAVAARLREAFPDRTIAVVMVGGGGDLLRIAIESSMGRGSFRLKPVNGPDPTPEQLDELAHAYLNHAKLDPLVVAPAIRDVPTLHVYADSDKIVPTEAAEQFNAAHGHVDRLVHAGNHGTLFYFLQGQAGKVRSWLRRRGIEE